MNVEKFTHGHELVPNFHGVIPGNPDFVAEIAGLYPGAGDVDGDAGDSSVGDAKIFKIGNAGVGCGVEEVFRMSDPCNAEERRAVSENVFELDHRGRGAFLLKPAEAGIGRRVQRYSFSPKARDVVPSSMTLPSESHQQQ